MAQELKALSATAKLELHLLGAARIVVDGAPVDERLWTRRKSKALIKLLALAPRHQLHREQLMEQLWPEMEPELAANNLHKVIHAARRALEPQLKSGADSRYIQTQDQQIVLTSPGELWIDVEIFEQRAEAALKSNQAAAYEAALELYQGELLTEDRYEDWTTAKREQLSLLAQRLLNQLAQIYEQTERSSLSLDCYRRLLAFDPANEEAHRHLMRLYALAGNRSQALQQYQACREALRRELNAEPEAATVKLSEQIAAGLIQTDAPDLENLAEPNQSKPSTVDPNPAKPQRSSRAGIYALLAVALLVASAGVYFFRRQAPDQNVGSIAVLPFANSSNDSDLEYLSDGITESIINSLSRLPGLRVMARTTAFRYKGREIDPQTIGSQLKVQAILTGRIAQRGEMLMVQTELVDVTDGSQLWGAQFNRPLADIFSVQTEIAREISDKLRLRLTTEEQQRFAKQHTENIEAYQSYLKGRYYWNRRTVPELQRAIEHFNRAIALDPGYAPAYAGLADAYHTLSNLWLPPTEAIPRARQAAMKALELDDQLSGAHASLAVGKWRFDWDWEGAEREFKRAIELDPNYAPAHQWYGQFLTYQKKFPEGLAELKRAQQLDPLSLVINANLGLPPYFSRDYDGALAQFQRALELDQNFPFVHFFLGWAYEQKKDYTTALSEFKKAVDLDATPSALAYLGHGYALSGNRREANAIISNLEELSKKRYVSPYYIAIVYAGLDEQERALDWLIKAVEDHSDPMVLINVEPKFDGLRASPRFIEITRRIRFPN